MIVNNSNSNVKNSTQTNALNNGGNTAFSEGMPNTQEVLSTHETIGLPLTEQPTTGKELPTAKVPDWGFKDKTKGVQKFCYKSISSYSK